MGRSWNVSWYKVFSFSTTLRNPIRNLAFLTIFKDFDGKVLDIETKNILYEEIIRRWAYRFSKISNAIKTKYINWELLTDEEVKTVIEDNPQKTWKWGRLMTWVRAIKDCWLISLTEIKYNTYLMKISELGNQLLEWYNPETVYAKALIWCHAKNPQREAIFNESRPFLNTIFVINEINKKTWNNKWILEHEFWAFVLSMKDCNFLEAANDILKYREKYWYEINQEAIENYLYKEKWLVEIDFKDVYNEYPDDVFRKFDMTWLFDRSWFWWYCYIRFKEFNLSKVNQIIEEFKDYWFQKFSTPDEYVKYLSEIQIPWEISDDLKVRIIEEQEKELEITVDKDQSYDNQMKELTRLYNNIVFSKCVDSGEFDIELIKKELKILCGSSWEKTMFNDIPEPVRLEWLIALITASTYGSSYVKPNLLFDNDWLPKSFAPWWMADIEFISEKLYCLIEVTLMKDYKQQVNSETTSISDHLDELQTDKKKCSLLLAPYIHHRVVRYFQFESKENDLSILALSILLYLKNIENHWTIDDFINMINHYTEKLNTLTNKEYADLVNSIE